MSDSGHTPTEKILLAILAVTFLCGAIQLVATSRKEMKSPKRHWEDPAFARLAQESRGIDSAIFLTDPEGIKSGNERIHTCQLAIIPAKLTVFLDWASAFAEIDRGSWVVFDSTQPEAIDDAEKQLREWSAIDDRVVEFKRLGPKLAFFRSIPNSEGAK